MRSLTLEEIAQIIRDNPDARRRAVENFLLSFDPKLSFAGHMLNLQLDKNLYNWKQPTVDAIRAGLLLACYGDRRAAR